MVFSHSLVSIETVSEIAVALIHHKTRASQRISRKFCTDLLSALKAIESDNSLKAGILCSDDGRFPSGLDLNDLETPELGAYFREATEYIAASSKLWIAALQGPIQNAGLELALACDMRIAMEGTYLRFSDGAIQLLPCTGVAARLVRLTQGETALGLLLGEQTLSTDAAQATGLIDVSVSGNLQVEAVTFAQATLNLPALKPKNSVKSQGTAVQGWRAPSTAQHRLTDLRTSGNPIYAQISHIVNIAMTASIQEAVTAEWNSFKTVLKDSHARIPRYLRQTAEHWQRPPTLAYQSIPLRSVHLVSDQVDEKVATTAATLFRAKLITVCYNFTNSGQDLTKDCICLLLEHDYITPQEATQWRVQLLETPHIAPDLVLDLRTAPNCDSMSALEATLSQKTVLVGCSHTYYKTATSKTFTYTERCLSMPLLGLEPISTLVEIIPLTDLPPSKSVEEQPVAALALAQDLTSLLDLTCLDRSLDAASMGWTLLSTCLESASTLLLEGATPQDIDSAMVNYGFAYGIFELDDEIGLNDTTKKHTDWEPHNEITSHDNMSVRHALFKANRLGRRVGKGWYDYPEGTRFASPEVASIIGSLTSQNISENRRRFSPGMIMSQLLFSMQQTARNMLDQRLKSGHPATSAFLDLILIDGFGFPPRHGGPIFMPEDDM